jgi:anti-sigma regulatory factor (Ser/Thr protein kinase)
MRGHHPYRPADRRDALEHYALLYNGVDDYLSATVPFVLRALDAGEPVLVAVPLANLALIGAALGAAAAGVRFVDMTEAGRNPGRIIPTVLRAFAEEHAGTPVRIVGESVWAGRSAAEYPACLTHEALINLALAERRGTVLCPYDAATLDRAWMVDAERTHPEVVRAGYTWPSYRYEKPADLVAGIERLPDPPDGAVELVFSAGLPMVRRFVGGAVGRVGLPVERLGDAVLAVNEVATNTLLHSDGLGVLRVWGEGGYVVCEVRDGGYLEDPLAGMIAPVVDSAHGRGLLLVHSLCDLVRIDTRPGGTAVRMYFLR